MNSNSRILLFNVNSKKSKQIEKLCKQLGIKVTNIYPVNYSQKLGYLAGIDGFKRENIKYSGDELASEMLLFSGINSEMMDKFLTEYKKALIPPIGLKAVITMHNIFWKPTELYSELLKEHKLLN